MAQGPRARCRRRCSTRRPRRSSATRSSSSTPSTARASSACPARGGTGCRTSAWASRPARATSCRPSTCCPVREPARRSTSLRGLTLPGLLVCELRTVAADTLWMSPSCGRDTLAMHFTFEQVPIEGALRDIEAAFAPFDPRPHPGKVHLSPGTYERAADFDALAAAAGPARRVQAVAAASSSSTTRRLRRRLRLDVVEHDGHDPGHRDGEEHADDPAEDAAGRERDHDHRRMQVDGAPHQHRVQHVPLDLLDDDDRASTSAASSSPPETSAIRTATSPARNAPIKRHEGREERDHHDRDHERDADDQQREADQDRVREPDERDARGCSPRARRRRGCRARPRAHVRAP